LNRRTCWPNAIWPEATFFICMENHSRQIVELLAGPSRAANPGSLGGVDGQHLLGSLAVDVPLRHSSPTSGTTGYRAMTRFPRRKHRYGRVVHGASMMTYQPTTLSGLTRLKARLEPVFMEGRVSLTVAHLSAERA
jgi:hypothetical protein